MERWHIIIYQGRINVNTVEIKLDIDELIAKCEIVVVLKVYLHKTTYLTPPLELISFT